MENFLTIFAEPAFVAIAWVCTVVSCIYAFVQKGNVNNIEQKFSNLTTAYNDLKFENNTLQQNFETLEVSFNALQVQNISLEKKILEIESNDIHDNYQEVNQNGQNNFNQGVIKGDFVFNK